MCNIRRVLEIEIQFHNWDFEGWNIDERVPRGPESIWQF